VSTSSVLQRLRVFLLSLSGFILIGTAIELWFTDHTETPLQFIPFILCAIGLAAVALALFHPQRATLMLLRTIMLPVVLGSLLGMYEHITSNLSFELDIRPNAVAGDVLMDALHGAAPLLAPGVLALAAILAIAATYAHPALEKRSGELSRPID